MLWGCGLDFFGSRQETEADSSEYNNELTSFIQNREILSGSTTDAICSVELVSEWPYTIVTNFVSILHCPVYSE